jgi:hypothetical protein
MGTDNYSEVQKSVTGQHTTAATPFLLRCSIWKSIRSRIAFASFFAAMQQNFLVRLPQGR